MSTRWSTRPDVRPDASRQMSAGDHRLILRPYATTDFEESAAMWGNPDVVRFIGGQPATREASWSRTLRYIGHWTAFGYGMWAVRDHENRFCGDVGICDFQRDIDPKLYPPIRDDGPRETPSPNRG